LRKFSSTHIATTGFLALFGSNEWQRNILTAADEKIFNKVVPKDWHYIAYGIAIK
jgi:hypothetical protein